MCGVQLLGVAFVLLALLAWNDVSGGFDGMLPAFLAAIVSFVLLVSMTRTRRPARVGVVAGGAVLTMFFAAGYAWTMREPVGAFAITGLVLGCAAGCLVPMPAHRYH